MNLPRPRREPIPRKPREVALEALYAVDRRHAFSDRLLHKLLRDNPMDERDAAMVTAIVRGTLRMRGRIDQLLNHYVKIGLDALPPWIQNILRMGVYQLLYMDRVPDRAAVDESVTMARKFGHAGTAGLVNAVLRKIAADREHLPEPSIERDPAGALAALYSHPEWMVRRWLTRYGLEETRALLQANNESPPVTVRVDRRHADPAEFLAALRKRGLPAEPGRHHLAAIRVAGDFVPAREPGFAEGAFVVQDESESLVVDLLAPGAGQLVIDLCAAPGGKATQISERIGPTGHVVAVEAQRGRLKPLVENRSRLGCRNMSILLADGTTMALTRPADCVLVDAPCSGLGVLAKRADARWRKTEASIRQVAALQERLILAGASFVRPGGALVYSVCSIEPDEGVRIIERFLKERSDFAADDAARFLPAEVVENGMLVTLPHRHGMDGAFAARLLRKE